MITIYWALFLVSSVSESDINFICFAKANYISFKRNKNYLIKIFRNLLKKTEMNEFIVTLIFIVILVSGVYFYAGYLTRTGKAEDADGNFIPDSWEEKFGWFFTAKGLIMFVLGLALGYLLGNGFPIS